MGINSLVRHLRVPHASSLEPVVDFRGAQWEVASPHSIHSWSAVGTFMAHHLQASLGCPIGIVCCAKGATRIGSWLGPKSSRGDGKTLEGGESMQGELYSGMVHPFISFAVKGVMWYQGETDVKGWQRYRAQLPCLINSWRRAWGKNDMPWCVVQLPGFMPPSEVPVERGWADMRESQRLGVQEAGGAGIVCTVDLGDAANIHPGRKPEVGRRLALWARARVYGHLNVVASGPILCAMRSEGVGSIVLRLRFHCAPGLTTRDGGPPQGFALADSKGCFHWADARLDGEEVLVWHPTISLPTAVAYSWQSNPLRANLINGSGLPALPFQQHL